jgi:hypothetical protein
MAVVTKDGESNLAEEVGDAEKAKYMRPRDCRTYLRTTLAKEFEGIVAGFVEAAKGGSCPHLKLATELLKPTRRGPSRKKGPVMRYWEQLEKEKREKELTAK